MSTTKLVIEQKQPLFTKRQNLLDVIENIETMLLAEGDVLIRNKENVRVLLREDKGTKAIVLNEVLKSLKTLVIETEQDIMDVYEVPSDEFKQYIAMAVSRLGMSDSGSF